MSGIGPISGGSQLDVFVGAVSPLSTLASAATNAANSAYLNAFTVRAPKLVTQVRILVGVQNGNVDVGIYSAAGARLASTGSTAVGAVGAAQVIALAASVTLAPGVKYWAAIASDSATAAFYQLGVILGNVTGMAGYTAVAATSFPLPAGPVTLTVSTNRSYMVLFE